MPLVNKQYDLKPDMAFGKWKPKENIIGAPIPLYFDYETFDFPFNPLTKEEYEPLYYGPRIKDSLEMHKKFANQTPESYTFKFPPSSNVIDALKS